MNVPAYWHTWKGNTCCDVISSSLRHARTYPATTQKGVANVYLYELQHDVQCMCISVLRFSCYVAIDTYNGMREQYLKYDDQNDN